MQYCKHVNPPITYKFNTTLIKMTMWFFFLTRQCDFYFEFFIFEASSNFQKVKSALAKNSYLNHLKINCWTYDLPLLNTWVCFVCLCSCKNHNGVPLIRKWTFFITTIQPSDPIQALPLVSIIFFTAKGYSSELHVAFNCHVLLVSFNIALLLSLSLTLMILNSKRLQAINFFRIFLNFGLSAFPHN